MFNVTFSHYFFTCILTTTLNRGGGKSVTGRAKRGKSLTGRANYWVKPLTNGEGARSPKHLSWVFAHEQASEAKRPWPCGYPCPSMNKHQNPNDLDQLVIHAPQWTNISSQTTLIMWLPMPLNEQASEAKRPWPCGNTRPSIRTIYYKF